MYTRRRDQVMPGTVLRPTQQPKVGAATDREFGLAELHEQHAARAVNAPL